MLHSEQKNVTRDQRSFMKNVFAASAIRAAVGRAKAYRAGCSDESRKHLRNTLSKALIEIGSGYTRRISSERHSENVERLSKDISKRCARALPEGGLRIGIAQKALNVYLKLAWCAGWIAEPPHCPFDSVVIRAIPTRRTVRWTRLKQLHVYEDLVAEAHKIADGESLAVWELRLYSAWKVTGDDEP